MRTTYDTPTTHDVEPDRPADTAPSRGHVPGEPAFWVLIVGDMMMFGWMFVVFAGHKFGIGTTDQLGTFQAGHEALNPYLGAVNTALLLTSSWFAALGVRAARRGRLDRGRRCFSLAAGCGAAFVAVKAVEWGEKIADGRFLNTDLFFTFYYTYTGIHLLHVLIGLGVLWYVIYHCCAGSRDSDIAVMEGGACFWHMVDVFWIVLFTLFYIEV